MDTKRVERTLEQAPAIARFGGVDKRFGEVVAVDRLDLTLHSGQTTAILGPNGAGKTTILNLLLGLVRPDRGEISLFDSPPSHLRARRRLGAMLQISGVPPTLTVNELVTQFRGYYPNPLARPEVLRLAGVEALGQRRFGRLSGGQKQRVLFALAICGQPEMLFLDEPSVGMDVLARRSFWRTLHTLSGPDRAIILTTHYLEEADALADRVVVVDRGRIIADGSPDAIKSVVSSRTIRCRTKLSAEQIRAVAGVSSVSLDASGLTCVTTTAVEQSLRQLLASDPGLSDLEVRRAALEEAFVHLTNGAAVEGAA